MKERAYPERPGLPGGTVTFLFTDIAGSTRLLQKIRERYKTLLLDHHRIVRQAIKRWSGREVSTEGDAFFVSFAKATEAVAAAVEIQKMLAEHSWPGDAKVRVRIGLHTGEPWILEADYAGIDVHRAARIAHAGHGGQVLLSETTAPLVRDDLPDRVQLRDLGHYRLKDMNRPERIHQLTIDGLSSDFPPLDAPVHKPAETPLVEEVSRLPAFLGNEEKRPGPLFVGREKELAWLMDRVYTVLNGQEGSPVLFVTGDPGSGKSALFQALARRASERQPDLLVAFGSCNAYSGVGDPYLPFRDVLKTLTGDITDGWRTGILTSGQARILWEAQPEAARALLDQGPGLIGTLLSGPATLARFRESLPENAPALTAMAARVEGDAAVEREVEQSQLFDQVTQTLLALSEKRPLLIALDDLQWVDQASTNLLFHLGRRLAGSRVLLLGAYRTEEVTLGRDGDRHPLEKVVSEFRRAFGPILLDLNQTATDEGGTFVEALVDSEPNVLGSEFRRALLAHTGGHPLFTVEMLRTLQGRGDLVRDEEGRWVEGPALTWEALPDRLEGVIAERIGRLEEELREILSVAAVEGDRFTAQVVARVQELQERGLLRTLSRELEKRHQLVQEGEARQVGRRLLSRYRFSHTLFQRYLYNDLSAGERRLLHGEIGAILEELYEGREEEVAVQLARHFAEAGEGEKVVRYSLQAGDVAYRLFAFGEAARAFEQALVFLREGTDQELAPRTLMKLGLVYHRNFEFERSREAYEEGFNLLNARSTGSGTAERAQSSRPLAVWGGTYATLDPTRSGDVASTYRIVQLFEGLVEMTQGGEIVPALASRWEIEDGGARYIFHLRDDIRWSDGKPITAHDVVFGWRWALRPGTEAYPSNQLYDVKGARAYHEGRLLDPAGLGVTAISERTLAVELKEPVGYFLLVLASPITFPIPKHVVEEFGEDWARPDHLVGSGAFVLESEEPDGSLNFKRNPYYTGWALGNITSAKISMAVSKPLLAMYDAGEIDYLYFMAMLTVAEQQVAAEKYPDELRIFPFMTTDIVEINVRKAPFDDVLIRQALAMATDRQALARNFGVNRFPAPGGFVPPGLFGHLKGVSLDHDPGEAKRLLAAAGYPDGQGFPGVSLIAGSDAYFLILANELVRAWRDVLNIPVELEEYNFKDLIARTNAGQYDIAISSWGADHHDPDSFLRASSFRGNTGWDHEEYYGLVDRARLTMDREQRLAYYRKAEKIIAREVPIIPLAHSWRGYLVKPWLKNFYCTLNGYELLKHMILEERDG